MSTFMGLTPAEYFHHRPKPMPVHPTFRVIEPGTKISAVQNGLKIVGHVRYPDEDDIPGVEPDWLGLVDDEDIPPWNVRPWVVIATGPDSELNVFLDQITGIL
jgi:hypothetical protein